MDDAAQAQRDQDGARAALLELATSAAGIGTFDWDLTTGALSWDERLDELLGHEPGAVDRTMAGFTAHLHPEDAPRVIRLLQQAVETRGDYEAEYRVVVPGAPVRWLAARGRVLTDEDGTAARLLGAAWDVSARRRVQEEAERATARERLLSSITDDLAATLDADEAVTRLSRFVVPAIADWCIVTLVADDREAGSQRGLRDVTSWHADPAARPVAEAYARGRLAALTDGAMIVRALHTGQPQLLRTGATATAQGVIEPGPVRDLFTRLAPESVAVVPLPGRFGPVGLLTLANGAARGPLRAEDLSTAGHVAARAGLVLDNARLVRQQRDMAEGLQRSLLTPPPQPDHQQIVVRYVPATRAAEVGGDWYDAFLQPAGATVLVIGDVIGHDTQAAAAMGQIRSMVRTIGAEDGAAPAEVLRRTDQVMETLRTGTAATAVVARLEQSADERARGVTRLRWSNAGHPPPMALDADGGVVLLATATADRLLGVTPDAPRRESEVVLDGGAVVLLYTDGLVERRDQDLDAGLDRLQRELAALAGRDLDEVCDRLLERMLPDNPEDDVALVAVRLHPQDGPRPPEAGPADVPRSG
ncbi:SpoIIE family protein phosphatase [Geodermatophilus sp. URMC 62]|uniref:SpoIIE family protein phosphatase n=1 Tax=Geodermatophilus sp. URMC 62 TaxID=3423414 RepID=UPI00406C6A3E